MKEMTSSEERTLGVLLHLSPLIGYMLPFFGNIVAPLILWSLKKNESEFVNLHGKEAINFQISTTIYALVLVLLMLGISIPLFLDLVNSGGLKENEVFEFFMLRFLWWIPIMFISMLVFYVPMIIGAIKAGQGKQYKSIFTIRFIK